MRRQNSNTPGESPAEALGEPGGLQSPPTRTSGPQAWLCAESLGGHNTALPPHPTCPEDSGLPRGFQGGACELKLHCKAASVLPHPLVAVQLVT